MECGGQSWDEDVSPAVLILPSAESYYVFLLFSGKTNLVALVTIQAQLTRAVWCVRLIYQDQ